MITELGKWFLGLGLAAFIVSTIMIAALTSLGLPVPDIIARSSSLPLLITGKASLSTLLNFSTTIATGIGAWALVSLLVGMMRGASGLTLVQALQLKAIAAYLALWVPFADGITVVLRSFGSMFASLYPGPLSSMIWSIFLAFEAFAKFTVIYYIASRVLGLPAE